MFKKIELWIVLILAVLAFIVLILYGALLRHAYTDGPRFPKLQKIGIFLAEIAPNTKKIFSKSEINEAFIKDEKIKVFFVDEKKFKSLLKTKDRIFE